LTEVHCATQKILRSVLQSNLSHSSYLPFWGKARGGVHPLWMHSLDVAAVGYELAGIRPRTLAALSERLGWEVQDLQALWTFLLALHDIGKFALQFQAKVPNAWPAETLGPFDEAHIVGGDPGHGAAGLALLLTPKSSLRPKLETWLFEWDQGEHETRPILLAPVLGHHGRPVAEPRKPLQDLFSPSAEAAALAFANDLSNLLQPPRLPEPTPAVPSLAEVASRRRGRTPARCVSSRRLAAANLKAFRHKEPISRMSFFVALL
jgi:CRISPR-associated endonuclease/helicase Cas3